MTALSVLFHAPRSVGKEEHTGAVEQPILKLARVAGPVLKLELANAVSPTWKDTSLAVSSAGGRSYVMVSGGWDDLTKGIKTST